MNYHRVLKSRANVCMTPVLSKRELGMNYIISTPNQLLRIFANCENVIRKRKVVPCFTS